MDNFTEVQRASQAQEILNNPLFIEAIDEVKKGIIYSMTVSSLGDSDTHNRLVIAMQLLNQIEKQLKDHVATGKMASLQINDKRKFW